MNKLVYETIDGEWKVYYFREFGQECYDVYYQDNLQMSFDDEDEAIDFVRCMTR